MPSAESSRSTRTQSKPASSVVTGYLILYNFVSAIAWATVLGRTAALYVLRGPNFVYLGVGEWTKWTQTAALLEVFHALFGIVRSPVFTTVMQVSSRLLLVWPVVDVFPWVARSPFYTSMLLAWSITEVVRYSFFALQRAGVQPRSLTFLRYNAFFILYPIGIVSECMLVYTVAPWAGEANPMYGYVLYAILAAYVPGSYILYTYMMAQRRKVMKGLKSEGTDKAE